MRGTLIRPIFVRVLVNVHVDRREVVHRMGVICLHEACHDKMAAHPYQSSGSPSQPSRLIFLLQIPRTPTMEAESQRLKEREGFILALNAAIETMNLAKELSSITPAKTVFGTVSVVLTMTRVSLFLAC